MAPALTGRRRRSWFHFFQPVGNGAPMPVRFKDDSDDESEDEEDLKV